VIEEYRKVRKDMSERFDRLIYGLVLALLAGLQLEIAYLHIRDFNWLTFIDHDLIYQVERFLLNLDYPGIEMLNSGVGDYGSELFLLIPIYRLYALIVPGADPLHAFHFLFLVHLVCAILAILCARRYLKNSGSSVLISLLFLLVIVSSPLMATYAAFVKPDPNVVLLLIMLALAALVQYLESRQWKWLLAAVVCGAAGTAVKYWGVFVLIPAIWATWVVARRSRDGQIPLWVVTLELAGALMLTFLIYRAALLNFQAIMSDGGSVLIAKLPDAKREMLHSGMQRALQPVWLAAALLAFTGFFGGLVLLLKRLEQKPEDPETPNQLRLRIRHMLTDTLKIGSSFYFWVLCLDLPMFLSEQFLHSAKNKIPQLLLHPSKTGQFENLGAAFYHNVQKWITFMQTGRVLYPLLICLVSLICYGYFQRINKLRSDPALMTLALFILPLVGFLILLVTKTSGGTLAMLFVLITLLTLMCWGQVIQTIPGKPGVILAGGAIFLTLLGIGHQNTVSVENNNLHWQGVGKYSLSSFYLSKRRYADQITALNDNLNQVLEQQAFDFKQKRLFLCQRDFPVNGNLIRTIRFDFKESRQLESTLSQAVAGDFLLLTRRQHDEYQSIYGRRVPIDNLIQLGKIKAAGVVITDRLSESGAAAVDIHAYIYEVI